MRKQFDQDLNRLKERLLTMAATAEQMTRDAIAALMSWDYSLFAPVEQNEEKMDAMQRELDEEVVRLIAVYTPVAADLRLLMMAARINAELERIGDKAIDIGFYAKTMLQERPIKPLVDLPRMADLAMDMVRKSVDAFAEGSCDKALAVVRMDDQVDRLNDQIFRELMTYVLSDPKTITRVLELVMISRSFERIADHAVNIGEDVVYMVKGEDIRHVKTPCEGSASSAGTPPGA
jgi:phosphate transport system protein